MAESKEFMVDGKYLDIIIQMALREIDPETLATALIGQDEPTREVILRNLSQRGAACLTEEIRKRSTATPESIRAGLQAFVSVLEGAAVRHAEEDAREYEAYARALIASTGNECSWIWGRENNRSRNIAPAP